jgi:hypothetical protein
VTALEYLANAIRLIGLVITVGGLWFSAGGMRLVVSGRIDERRKSANSLKLGLPMLAAGLILLVGGFWLAKWAHRS